MCFSLLNMLHPHSSFQWKITKVIQGLWNWKNRDKCMWRLWNIACVLFRFLLRLKCFSVGISGLSFVCGKSWEGCDWAFYFAACKPSKGIAPILVSMLRHIFCFVFNRKRKMFLCSEEENLINLASIVLIQQCSAKSSQHILWETSMILHLIHYSHRLSTICHFWTLKASLKMNALEKMPPPRLMWKGILLSVQTYGVVGSIRKCNVKTIKILGCNQCW